MFKVYHHYRVSSQSLEAFLVNIAFKLPQSTLNELNRCTHHSHKHTKTSLFPFSFKEVHGNFMRTARNFRHA